MKQHYRIQKNKSGDFIVAIRKFFMWHYFRVLLDFDSSEVIKFKTIDEALAFIDKDFEEQVESKKAKQWSIVKEIVKECEE